ncbi:MAG: ParB/Srx family N-terminal domain-containing protein, partial [Bacteroidales bacterium]
MDIIYMNPSSLLPYVNNARRHPEKQINKLMASIQEFGFVIPVFLDRNNIIIKGHGVTLAAIKLGIDKIPCIYIDSLSEAQQRAYIIADNRLAEDSEWDKETLAAEMLRLRDDLGVDLSVTGFESREVLSLNLDNTDGFSPEDDVLDLDPVPVTQLGDVWILGNHRIICGDCTSPDIVNKLFAGLRPHLMVTDPPYG